MQIRVLLNSQAQDVGDIRAQLDAELHAALKKKSIRIETRQRELEAGTLSIVEAYEFIISHGPGIVTTTLPLITAVLQLTNAILQRRGIKRQAKPKKSRSQRPEQKPSEPTIVVYVDERSIELPANDAQLKRYLTSIRKSEKSSPIKARREGTKATTRKAHK